ncbi:MAG TPA: MtrAB system histidine kinase MtrB [Jiangellaceae bacterium]|nr:MtrAB system histidine kinase MtrB [Jiangellaceae bacterium]
MSTSARTRWMRAVSRIWVAAARLWREVSGAWQRSMQVRVVVTTLVLSMIVVTLLGLVLIRQVTDGLLESREDAAIADASAGLTTVQTRLDNGETTDEGAVNQLLAGLVSEQFDRAGEDPRFYVMMLGSEHGWRDGDTLMVPPGIGGSSIPDELREQVTSQPEVFWTYSTISRAGEPDEPGLVVGGEVTVPVGGQYELYYLFPMSEEQATINLVTTALLTAGMLLVLLLGAIAWLTTRQAVTPIRVAAQIAGRLADGQLSERMPETRRDELAKLASGFNQMANSLQTQIRQLEDLSRMQQRFVSDVSHELRTPITTVRMAADVIHDAREDIDDPVVLRSIELLQTQLGRFEELLGDLLEISRFDAGAAELNAVSNDVGELVRTVVEGAMPLAEQKGSQVRVDMPEDPAMAEIDTRRIQRVLRNLVVNAIEHGEGQPVSIRVGVSAEAVAVSVRDHGVGLKPGESSLVFRRFWRADPARARTTGGTGLGLPISLEDARLHGGWLHAWGEPAKGSNFRLTLPVRVGGEVSVSPLPLVPEEHETESGEQEEPRALDPPAPHASAGTGGEQ